MTTHAVKSPPPVTAREPSWESREDQTAPLWPRNVPSQSPSQSRSIGLPSLHELMSR